MLHFSTYELPRQQWFRERASVLPNLYNTSLVLFTLGDVVRIILHSDITVVTILLFLFAPLLYL